MQVVSWHNVLAFRLAQATARTCDGNTATSSERLWSGVWGRSRTDSRLLLRRGPRLRVLHEATGGGTKRIW